MKKKLQHKTKSRHVDKWEEVLKRIGTLHIETTNINCKVDTYDLMRIKNPHNVSEILDKIAVTARMFEFLGTAIIEASEMLAAEEIEYKIWIEKKKSKYDGDKKYNSDASKERQIIVKYPKKYRAKNQAVRDLQIKLSLINNKKTSVEKLMWVGQTIAAVLKKERK